MRDATRSTQRDFCRLLQIVYHFASLRLAASTSKLTCRSFSFFGRFYGDASGSIRLSTSPRTGSLFEEDVFCTLLGLASSRRATDWLWVQTDTDDCAIFSVALSSSDHKWPQMFGGKGTKRFHTLTFTFHYPNNSLITFTLFLTSVNAIQIEDSSKLALPL